MLSQSMLPFKKTTDATLRPHEIVNFFVAYIAGKSDMRS
jgi:hypothetical protein